MTKRWAGFTAVAVLLALLSAYVASPVMALQTLKSAAEAGDAARLEQVVDFPAVRESLKDQLNVRLLSMAEHDRSVRENAFAGLAMLLAPTLVNKAVDAFVTPASITAMVAHGRAGQDPAEGAWPEPRLQEAPARITRGYRNIDTFVVASISRADPRQRVEFTFSRTGLFAWRLTRIGLPPARVARAS